MRRTYHCPRCGGIIPAATLAIRLEENEVVPRITWCTCRNNSPMTRIDPSTLPVMIDRAVAAGIQPLENALRDLKDIHDARRQVAENGSRAWRMTLDNLRAKLVSFFPQQDLTHREGLSLVALAAELLSSEGCVTPAHRERVIKTLNERCGYSFPPHATAAAILDSVLPVLVAGAAAWDRVRAALKVQSGTPDHLATLIESRPEAREYHLPAEILDALDNDWAAMETAREGYTYHVTSASINTVQVLAIAGSLPRGPIRKEGILTFSIVLDAIKKKPEQAAPAPTCPTCVRTKDDIIPAPGTFIPAGTTFIVDRIVGNDIKVRNYVGRTEGRFTILNLHASDCEIIST